MSAASIACRDVTVRYGSTTALDVPRFEVRAGETVAIIGPNGCGKSTLLGVLGLTLTPTAGVVEIGGEQAVGAAARRRLRRRVVSQLQDSLLLDATVAWNIGLPLRLRRVARDVAAARVATWARAFGIEALLARHVAGLSGGEARRACLARAFAVEPDVLLIDEPLAGVDAPFREEIVTLLGAALRERRWTTVMVTHDLAEGMRLADRLAILAGGRVRQTGTPAEVLAAPADPEVARVVGTETYLPARGAPGGRVRVGEASVAVARPVAEGTDAWLAIRPEDVTLATEPSADALPATVVELRPRGATTSVLLDAGFPLRALVLAGGMELRAGDRVWARVVAAAIPRR